MNVGVRLLCCCSGQADLLLVLLSGINSTGLLGVTGGEVSECTFVQKDRKQSGVGEGSSFISSSDFLNNLSAHSRDILNQILQ